MTVENLNAISWLVNNGLLTPDNALGSTLGTWTTNVDNAAWDAVAEMANPVGTQANGTHSVTVRCRKDAGTNNPSITIDVLDGADNVLATQTTIVSLTTTQIVVVSGIDSALLNAAVGGIAGIKVRLTAPATGGGPSARSVVQIDNIVWSGDFTTPEPPPFQPGAFFAVM